MKTGADMHDLTRHWKDRALVSIYRDGIDNQSIEGYVLGVSAQLAVLQYVHDFRLDGLRVLRIADITEVDCSETCGMQQELMRQEGLEKLVPFGAGYGADNWRQAITLLSQDYPLMILECEASDENSFVIGRVLDIKETSVTILGFSGAGVWDDAPTTLGFDDITSCQAGSNYLSVYQRHFERSA